MPNNFTVPPVGNPNGGFQNGDQVTADNLNAHVVDATPTGNFISGRNSSSEVNDEDYFLKVDANNDLWKISSSNFGSTAGVAKHGVLYVDTIRNFTGGDGVANPFGPIAINFTSNISFTLGSYSDPTNTQGGSFGVTGTGNFFYYKGVNTLDGGPALNGNSFYIGDESKRATFVVNSTETAFRNTWPVNFSYNTKALILPSGTTAQRPVANNGFGGVSAGMFRFNSDVNKLEYYGTDSNWNQISSYSGTIIKTGNVGTLGAGIVYRSSLEFDIPDNETWLFSIDAHWSTPASGNTQPGYWYETAIFATKTNYTDVELKRYITNYTPYSGINRLNVTIPLTKSLLANLSKKIEVRTYATNNGSTLATFSTLGGPANSNWFTVTLVKVKTSEFTANNAIL